MTGRHDAKCDLAVILPCYNPGPEIEWTLDSLRAQTIPFRLFVTDDGSANKPDYRALLEGFDYELIELEQNVGPCLVRNPSMQRALDAGFTYIAQFDCGDWAYPERFALQCAFLADHPSVGAVGSTVEVLNADMSHGYDFTPPTEPDAIRHRQFYVAAFKHPAIMYRASLLKKIGLYTGIYDAAEDYEMMRRVATVADLANLPQPLLKTVEYSTGVSATRRTAQLVSRLRIQWRYRELASLHCCLGMARTLATIALPARAAAVIRPFFHRHKPPADVSSPPDRHLAGQVFSDADGSRGSTDPARN